MIRNKLLVKYSDSVFCGNTTLGGGCLFGAKEENVGERFIVPEILLH